MKSASLKISTHVAGPGRLVSDPMAIHDLRLKDALAEVLHEALALHSAPLAELDQSWFAQKSESQVLGSALARAGEAAALTRSAIDQALVLQSNFSRETEGLVPIAKAIRALRDARENRRSLLLTSRPSPPTHT